MICSLRVEDVDVEVVKGVVKGVTGVKVAQRPMGRMVW